MKTIIDIDDALLEDVMRISGEETPNEAIEASLRKTVESRKLAKKILLDFEGTGIWEGNLEDWRMERCALSL